jgi:hypothetical protein
MLKYIFLIFIFTKMYTCMLVLNSTLTTVKIFNNAKNIYLLYNYTSNLSTNITFYSFPCFGEYNWFLGISTLPSSTNSSVNYCNETWQNKPIKNTYCGPYSVTKKEIFYILAQGIKNYSNNNFSAIFDFVIINGTTAIDFIPTPGLCYLYI